MRKPTPKEIARLLAARATPEPPPGLADRIKAEIPGSIRLERRALQPERRWLLPPLVEGLQPGWLAAASVLLVLGVGIVAARIPAQPDDVWKWMALSGVVHIDDIVVTAPEPKEPAPLLVAAAEAPAQKSVRQKAVSTVKGADVSDAALSANASNAPVEEPAPPAAPAAFAPAPPAEAAGRLAVSVSDGKEALAGVTVTATRADASEGAARSSVSDAAGRAVLAQLPPGEYRVRTELDGFRPLDTTVTVAPGAEAKVEFAMPQSALAEQVMVMGRAQAGSVSAEAAGTAVRPTSARAQAALAGRENAVTVSVFDQGGEPLEGATVMLERIGHGALWTRTSTTEADGAATFRGVPPATYRAVVTSPSSAPAQLLVNVTSDRAPTRAEIRVKPPRSR
ncbi:MAG TPA: carboxypeptidase-like regulatory domain-containing protein [Thermoanaerobaculaceae bacterium]|nr:carboxypeptidase-like regulatory domain-containing protein [Thermoanaerobaculaceae bacterium]